MKVWLGLSLANRLAEQVGNNESLAWLGLSLANQLAADESLVNLLYS